MPHLACDTVIWLDLPTAACLVSTVWRFLRYRGRTRSDMGEGCPEQPDRALLRWVASFRRQSRPRIVQKLRELPPSTEVVVLTSRREMARWLEGVRLVCQSFVSGV